MTRVLERLTYVANAGAKAGMLLSPAIPNGPHLPYFPDTGRSVGEFKPSAGTKVAVKLVHISAFKPNSCANNIAPGTNVNAGTLRINYGGSTVHEQRMVSTHINAPVGVADATATKDHNQHDWCFHAGITIPSGTALAVVVTPTTARQMNWEATIYGTESGTTVIQTSDLMTYDTAANQTVLTYTPSADFSLRSIEYNCEHSGAAIGFGTLTCASHQVMDLPPIGQNETSVVPLHGSVPQHGGIVLDFYDGIDMYPSDVLGAIWSPFAHDNSTFQVLVAGDSTSLSGGGNTYSRARVVNP